MKSIKERAEELVEERIELSREESTIYFQGIEAGAKYVLGEIESIMKNVSDEYPRFQQGTIIHVRLIKLLEQLKK